MNDAWFEGAPPPDFNGITQAAFLADITAAAADDATIADLEAELKMKREVRDDKYIALNEKRSKSRPRCRRFRRLRQRQPALRRNGLRPQIRPGVRPDPKNKTASRHVSNAFC